MNEQGHLVIEQCPLYILVYVCSFVPELNAVRCVSRKWAAAAQQTDLLAAHLAFDNAECINYYLDPLFDSMEKLVHFRLFMSSVIDQCMKVVERRIEAIMTERQKLMVFNGSLYNFVHANCKLFCRTHYTNWIPEGYYPWYDQSSVEANKNSPSDSDCEDRDFDVEDDGFRYFADEEEDEEDEDEDIERFQVPRWYRKRKHSDDEGNYD